MGVLRDGGRVIIGVVHLPPMPGSPRYSGGFEEILGFAVRNSRTLEEAGFDAVIIENFNDYPFSLRVRDPATIAAMALVVRDVVRALSIPVGINLLRNSGPEAAAIAAVSGASFIRSNAYCEVLAGPEGFMLPVARDVVETISRLGSRLEILADVLVKHASPIHSMELEDLVRDCVERCLADAVVITGPRTGRPPSPGLVVRAKSAGARVLVGSGVNPDNIPLYRKADGFIVGSYVKSEKGEVDLDKARRIVSSARSLKNA